MLLLFSTSNSMKFKVHKKTKTENMRMRNAFFITALFHTKVIMADPQLPNDPPPYELPPWLEEVDCQLRTGEFVNLFDIVGYCTACSDEQAGNNDEVPLNGCYETSNGACWSLDIDSCTSTGCFLPEPPCDPPVHEPPECLENWDECPLEKEDEIFMDIIRFCNACRHFDYQTDYCERQEDPCYYPTSLPGACWSMADGSCGDCYEGIEITERARDTVSDEKKRTYCLWTVVNATPRSPGARCLYKRGDKVCMRCYDDGFGKDVCDVGVMRISPSYNFGDGCSTEVQFTDVECLEKSKRRDCKAFYL